MRVPFRFSRLSLAVALSAAGAGACNVFEPRPVEVNGETATSFSVAVGREIDLSMQTIGPGSYAVPPTLAGSAVAYLEVTMRLQDPGGLTQVFHFRGVEPGTTVITFEQIDNNTPGFPHVNIVDTVTVR